MVSSLSGIRFDELPIRQRITYRTTREHLIFDDVNPGNAALGTVHTSLPRIASGFHNFLQSYGLISSDSA
jgi:hypothetical protein